MFDFFKGAGAPPEGGPAVYPVRSGGGLPKKLPRYLLIGLLAALVVGALVIIQLIRRAMKPIRQLTTQLDEAEDANAQLQREIGVAHHGVGLQVQQQRQRVDVDRGRGLDGVGQRLQRHPAA